MQIKLKGNYRRMNKETFSYKASCQPWLMNYFLGASMWGQDISSTM